MSFGFGVGNIIAVGKLTFDTYQKCSSASAEFQDLSQVAHSARLFLNSIRLSVEEHYDLLPQPHKDSLKSIILGLKRMMAQIFRELDRYQDLKNSKPSILTRAKFGTFETSTAAMQKLSVWITMLDTWMQIVIRDTIKKSKTRFL